MANSKFSRWKVQQNYDKIYVGEVAWQIQIMPLIIKKMLHILVVKYP